MFPGWGLTNPLNVRTFGCMKFFPIVTWAGQYDRSNFRSDLAAGLTVGAMLVPQAMAYAVLAGLPPAVGLYSATIPVIVYAFFGTSRQLAVGPVAIVSLLAASALAPIVQEGSAGYLAAAALLALMVGLVHLVLGLGRLGFLVNFLSHSVLVGFTAAAAIIIGFSQAKHLLGISTKGSDHFYQTVIEVVRNLGGTSGMTFAVGAISFAVLLILKKRLPGAPAALVVVIGSIVGVRVLGLEDRGVKVVGAIPNALPTFRVPDLDGSLIGSLTKTAIVITLVGFMESIAVAKVYARRHRYELEPNQELIGLGAANIAAGLFGGYPVSGGFSRTAVNDNAGAKTPFASLITAVIVLVTIAFLTPLLTSLPNAALGAIIVMAVVGLIDIDEVRHIAKVKPSDLVGVGVAFFGTLILGIELGIVVAVIASMLVVFARMSTPHSAVLGRVDGTSSYRNVERFPEAQIVEGVRILRIDSALSFVNAQNIKRLLLDHAKSINAAPQALVLDASGINDIDASAAEMLHEVLAELGDLNVTLHLAAVKGPVRDVLWRAGIWEQLAGQIHASTDDACSAVQASRRAPANTRGFGIDERALNLAAIGIETGAWGSEDEPSVVEPPVLCLSDQRKNISNEEFDCYDSAYRPQRK